MKPDLAAPTNVGVVGGYFGGTSAAAPHVAGEAALIWNQVAREGLPETVAGAVGERLRALALDMGAPGPDLRWGRGRTRVDTTPPALGATSPSAGQAVAGVVPLRLPLVEAGTFESTAVALDGVRLAATLGPDHALGASFDSRRLADGAHRVTVAASDKSGNAATFDVPLRVDNSPPVLGATQPAAGALVSRVVQVRLPLVDPAGIASASATLDGAPLVASLAADGTLTASFDSRGVADGVHHVTVRTADSLGNAAALDVPLLVDNTAPRLAVVAGSSVLAGAVYRVGVRAVDDLAGLSAPARVWFGDGAASAAPATHRYRRSGPHRLRVTAADRAGNQAVVSRPLRVVELRLAAPRHGAVVIVTLGRPNVVRIAAARVRLRRVLSAGRHRLSLGRLGRGRHVVTAEARGFRVRGLVRVP